MSQGGFELAPSVGVAPIIILLGNRVCSHFALELRPIQSSPTLDNLRLARQVLGPVLGVLFPLEVHFMYFLKNIGSIENKYKVFKERVKIKL